MKRVILCLFLIIESRFVFAQFLPIDGDSFPFCKLNGAQYNPGSHPEGEINQHSSIYWVITCDDKDFSGPENTYFRQCFDDNYPGHTILEGPTKSYNCHGYSHSIFQGGERCQIFWYHEILDDGFILVQTPQKGDIAIVRDYTDNTHSNYVLESQHSSVVVTQDTLISKWGSGPLTKHHKNDVIGLAGLASGMSVYTYYRRVKNTQLTGPDIIDGSGTYTFTPNVTPASCTWSVEPAAMFQTSSGTGYTANLTYATPFTYLAPKATITFTFSYSCDNHYSVSKEIDLLIPTTTISSVAVSEGFVIDTNAVVTVTGTIRSNANAKTIVPVGTKLIIDGGTLTNSSNGEMWPGIEVWGDVNAHQFTDHGNYLQGYLELKNGATIENAVCAVELWHPNDYSTTGGIVRADSAFFINNAKSVHALLYSNYNPVTGADMPYAASFDKCSFGIDSQYLGTQTFYKHIDIAHVDGFVFNGCSFTVANGVTGISPKCSAIAAYDAGFFVNAYCNSLLEPCPDGYLVHSSFSGFYDAVHAVHNGGTARSFVIKDAVFSNNDLGVYALNTGYASIRFNSFAVGRAYSCGYGIYVEDVTGLSIEENDFSPVVGYQGESYGIGVFNSLAPNDIYLNSFEGLTCGNFAYGLNTAKTQESPGTVQGLTYHCNQNTLNTIDFCVFNDHGDGGVCPLQGSSSRPAGNTFSGSDYHFYNDGENTVDYYYNSSATGQTPDSALLYRVNRFSTTNSSHCMSHGGGNVEKTQKGKEELKKDYQTATENFKRLARLYEELIGSGSTSEELAELMSQIAQYAYDRNFAAGEIVRINLSDTVANPQELRTWLLNAGDIASDRMAIASLVQEGDFDSAMELAKRFPDLYNLKDDDLVDYTHYTSLLALFKTLHETGRTTEQLNDEEIKMVEGIASLATGVSRSLAKALLEGQQGDSRSNYLCPELPINNSKGDLDVNEKKTSDFEIKVSPNPAQSQVLIEYTLPESSSYGLLKLVNALGEKQMELQLESSKGRKLIDIHGLPTGLYLIIVTDLNGRSHHCKLIKN